MTYTDRYYQREAREATEKGWQSYKSGILALGTGSGKTHIAARILGNIATPEARCLFLADQDELCAQPLRAIQRVTGIIPAIEKAKDRASLAARVVVGSSQTLCRKKNRERFPRDHFSHIMVDEAHRGTQRDADICTHFETAKICGMTATPFRSSLRDLSKWYEEVFYAKPMLDLVGEGFAPRMEVLTLPVEISLEHVRTAMTPEGKDYKAEDAASAIEPYLDAVAELVKEHGKGRHGIAYLPLIAMSEQFASTLRAHGITARHVDGSSPDRAQILEGFARGEFSWLCNAGVVSIGVDLPIADAFLNLSPLRSPALYQQRVGRVMRPLPGVVDDLPEKAQAAERLERLEWSDKPNALLFDLLWQNDELGVMRPASLVAENAAEAEAITERAARNKTPEDLAAIKQKVLADQEYKLVAALERAALRGDSRRAITFSDAAVLLGSKRLMSYEPAARWETDDPTEPQLAALARAGIDISTIATKGHAKTLLDRVFFRREQKLATLKQVRFIYSINAERSQEAKIEKPERLTFAEAGAIISAEMDVIKARRLGRQLATV